MVKELTVTGALNYDASGFDDALRLRGSGALPLNAVIAPGAVPLANILPAMEDSAAGHTAVKVLVAPGA